MGGLSKGKEHILLSYTQWHYMKLKKKIMLIIKLYNIRTIKFFFLLLFIIVICTF